MSMGTGAAWAEDCPEDDLRSLLTEAPDNPACHADDRLVVPGLVAATFLVAPSENTRTWFFGGGAQVALAAWRHPRGRYGPSHVALGGRVTWLADEDSSKRFVALEGYGRASIEPQALRRGLVPFVELSAGRAVGSMDVPSQTVVNPGAGIWLLWRRTQEGQTFFVWSVSGSYQLPLGSWGDLNGVRFSTQMELALW